MIDDTLIEKAEKKLNNHFKALDEISLFNQEKVLKAFQQCQIATRHFSGTTGYGHEDEGRDTLNLLIADIFRAEQAICSPNIVSGTHALSVTLYGILRPCDSVLSITGKPYDTLQDVIYADNVGSLKDYNITWENIELKNDCIDKDAIREYLSSHKTPKIVYMQRSRGYEWRNALSISQIKDAVMFLRELGYNGCIMLDNCYGEFIEKQEPTEVGVNILAGSLIKNLGGGLAPTGGYVVGDKKWVELVQNRLTSPSIGGDEGSYAYGYHYFYEGVFLAPHVVNQALKGSLLFGQVLNDLGYETSPSLDAMPADIIRAIKFNDKDALIKFICGIQKNSPVDSNVLPVPWLMTGYHDEVIMAAGCFTQGSSIELSADAPIRPPYIAYFQGGLTYEHCKIALKNMDL